MRRKGKGLVPNHKNIARLFLVAAATTVTLSAQSLIQGPSSSQSSYLTPTAQGWSATSLLTVGDAISGYQMVGIKVGENLTISLNVAYEHALTTDGGTLNASFADATAPTTFTVRTFGAGQDLLRGGIGFNLGLGEGRSAALSYDYHTGVDVESAHQIKASYSFRF